jgi:hypothetical protein
VVKAQRIRGDTCGSCIDVRHENSHSGRAGPNSGERPSSGRKAPNRIPARSGVPIPLPCQVRRLAERDVSGVCLEAIVGYYMVFSQYILKDQTGQPIDHLHSRLA